jgi:hypothetical protein
MASEVFEAQVALLVRVLPYIATETCHCFFQLRETIQF